MRHYQKHNMIIYQAHRNNTKVYCQNRKNFKNFRIVFQGERFVCDLWSLLRFSFLATNIM